MKFPKYYLEEGGILPRFYGVSYIDVKRQIIVCYPIPFNLLVNVCRKLYWKIKSPSFAEIEKRIAQAYADGRAKGFRAGLKVGWDRAHDNLLKMVRQK